MIKHSLPKITKINSKIKPLLIFGLVGVLWKNNVNKKNLPHIMKNTLQYDRCSIDSLDWAAFTFQFIPLRRKPSHVKKHPQNTQPKKQEKPPP